MSRVFISYGRADAERLALRLEKALCKYGHSVWLDRHEIKAGRAWEEDIEQGILASDAVIALLSPHAVRRPDGVCLDEISLARYNQKRIIPAMVIACRPPLGIYRLDWIDFQNWHVPAQYHRAFNRLNESLQQASASVEGVNAAVFSRLKPMDFGNELARLTRAFVGRNWLFEQIEQWLRLNDSRMFLVTGEPGIGKSAALASLVQRHPNVCAYHFCVADLLDSRDPVLFVKSIAAQLSTQFNSYRAALEAIDWKHETGADPGVLLRRLVADPLRSEVLKAPAIIVVDALDESLGYDGRHIARLIAERLKDLPPGVRIVASSRENADVLDLFSEYRSHPMQADAVENLEDASSFVEQKFNEPRMLEVLRSHHVSTSTVAATVLTQSHGNFLYLRYTLDALLAGYINPGDRNAFPEGLVGVYYSYFDRIFPNDRTYSEFRPLLNVVIASREPMDALSIGAIVGMDPFDVEREMQLVRDFFPKREGRYQAFHKSVVDWLTGRAGSSIRFQVNLKRGHQLIAAECWREYQQGAIAMREYGVRHALYHFYHAERPNDEVSLMRDPAFIRRRIMLGRGIYYSHSYRPSEQELQQRVALDLGAMGHSLFTENPIDDEGEWMQNFTSHIPSMSLIIGFTFTRNSPYLREDWRLARANGVPLILIMAEDSPWLSDYPYLAGVPCFDMRQWRNSPEAYQSAWSQLSALIGEAIQMTPAAPLRVADYKKLMIPRPQSDG